MLSATGAVTLVDLAIGIMKLADVYNKSGASEWDYRIKWTELAKAVFSGYPKISALFSSPALSEIRARTTLLLSQLLSEPDQNATVAPQVARVIDELLAIALLRDSQLISHLAVTVTADSFLDSLEHLRLDECHVVVGRAPAEYETSGGDGLPAMSIRFLDGKAELRMKARAVRIGQRNVKSTADWLPIGTDSSDAVHFLDQWGNELDGTVTSRVVQRRSLVSERIDLSFSGDREPSWIEIAICRTGDDSPSLSVYCPTATADQVASSREL